MDLLTDKKLECNYVYDEYMQDKRIIDRFKGAFTLGLGESLRLIKFFEYLPLDVDSINDTNTICKEELIAAKRDALVANAIKEKLRGNEYDEELYTYATITDIQKLIKHKFKSLTFRDRCNYFNSLPSDGKEEMISEYESRYDLNTEELALLYYMQAKKETKVRKFSGK